MTQSNKVKLGEELELSRIVHGHWRLLDWKMSNLKLLEFVEKLIKMGVTTFDHADIYGDYTCESLFGEALRLKQSLREEIQIVTKCGIKLLSDKFPERKVKHYDYTFEHIVDSVENSLKNLQTDYIDLLLLHRPAPLFDPEEVAKAFEHLRSSGKVLYFGVSNFSPLQFEMLAKYTDEELVTNQIEISPYNLEHFENGNIDFLLKEGVKPMAWSPLAGGKLLKPQKEDEKGQRLQTVLSEVAEELGVDRTDKLIYSWLLKHPATILPIIGSSKIKRIQQAIDASKIEMSQEQWYKIYTASTGVDVP